MSTHVTFDYSKALSFIGEHEITYLRDAVKVTHHAIHEKLEPERFPWVGRPSASI